MREIEFRGKTLQDEWIYGYIFKSQCGGYYIVDTNNDGDDGVEVRMRLDDKRKETVGQYTGLPKDKDTKIFEGDIVKVKNCETFIIKYQHNEFRFVPICNGYLGCKHTIQEEVILEVIPRHCLYELIKLLEVQKEK